MTSRERTLAALDHKQPDRCATFISINNDAMDQLAEHLGVEGESGVEKALRIDPWRAAGVPVTPAEDADARIRSFIPDDMKNDPSLRVSGTYRVVRNHPDAKYLEDVVYCPLQDVVNPAELDRFPFSKPEDVQPVTDEIRAHVQALKDGDHMVMGTVNQPFRIACLITGMDHFLRFFLERPDVVEGVYDKLYALNTAMGVAMARAGVDVLSVQGDIAMQDRLMMSPHLWRSFDKPRLAHVIAEAKKVNPDVKVFMHSDGVMTDIIPDLIEVGLDILNPIQPECMDPFAVKDQYGDRLTLHGAVSLQRTISFGTPQDVTDEVNRLVDHCGRDGGYICGPSNVLLSEFPVENIVALYEAVH